MSRPNVVYVAGFDEMTPQQVEFFEASANGAQWRSPVVRPAPRAQAAPRFVRRNSSAAAWARQLAGAQSENTNRHDRRGPRLTRRALERIFRERTRSRATLDQRAFHLSVGPPLAEYPVGARRLLMLEFATGKLAVAACRDATAIAVSRRRGKGMGDARASSTPSFARTASWDLSPSSLREEAGVVPQLQRVLRRVEKKASDFSRRNSDRANGARAFAELLDAFGWPGDRTPSSREFQTIEAWRGLLSSLASLDLTAPPMNLAQVVDWLHATGREHAFQMEDEGAPVQVMGMLEAAGLRFRSSLDHGPAR